MNALDTVSEQSDYIVMLLQQVLWDCFIWSFLKTALKVYYSIYTACIFTHNSATHPYENDLTLSNENDILMYKYVVQIYSMIKVQEKTTEGKWLKIM